MNDPVVRDSSKRLVLLSLLILLADLACGTDLQVSFPPADVPSLGPLLPACPCERRGRDLVLYVRITPKKPVPFSQLTFSLFSGGQDAAGPGATPAMDGGGDPLPVSVREPHAATISDDVVALVIGEPRHWNESFASKSVPAGGARRPR